MNIKREKFVLQLQKTEWINLFFKTFFLISNTFWYIDQKSIVYKNIQNYLCNLKFQTHTFFLFFISQKAYLFQNLKKKPP